MKTIKDKICSILNHKWNYFRVEGMDLRCCRRCGRLQHRMKLVNKEFWTFSVQYTEKGAKEHVKGYEEK